MDCDYQKFMDKLLAGNLDDGKLTELKKHALGCKDCSDKLMQIEVTDKIIKNDLLNVPYASNKDSIISKITISEFKLHTLSILYRSRKYICVAAAILIIIVSIHFIKPFIYTKNTVAQNNKATPSKIDINTSSNTVIDNNQNTTLSIDTRKLQFILPSNWSTEVYSSDSAIFHENDTEVGSLVINTYPYKNNEELIHNVEPNHSELLWTENISVPLGNGKMAAFKITSPAAAPIETVEFEINAIIPITADKAYEIGIKTKDASSSSKKLFMSILNNIKSCNHIVDNKQKASASVDVQKLKFSLPSDWSTVINSHYSISFKGNGLSNAGGLIVNSYPYRGEQLIQNIAPNLSYNLWTENISVPLGTGKMAAFKIVSPISASAQTEEFEIGAIIPISNDQAYEIWIKTKDTSDSSKKLFMDILNNIKY